MLERELKLHVPTAAQASLEQELRARGAQAQVLRALYFDTPGRELARARVALRVRLEDGQWVQTLKMPGGDALSRIELNHPRDEPIPDISLYEERRLRKLFAGLREPLGLRYETYVERLLLRLRTRSSLVELAYDRGVVGAAGHELPISEIEFELCEGAMTAVFALGKAWTRRHGLVLDMRSKAERGDILARTAWTSSGDTASSDLANSGPASSHPANSDTGHPGPQTQQALAAQVCAALAPPRKAAQPALREDMGLRQAARACAGECLEQIVRNATYAAGVDTGPAEPALRAEYVHQLRVGMRRLRSCHKLFAGWTQPLAPRVETALRRSFLALGATRDAEVVQREIAPRLVLAGMPPGRVARGAHKAGPDAAATLAASPEFQVLLLDLMADLVLAAPGNADESGDKPDDKPDNKPGPGRRAAMATGADSTSTDAVPQRTRANDKPLPDAHMALARRLDKWLRQLVGPGQAFATLAAEAQHDLRKKAKRLRYGLAFAAPFLDKPAQQRILAALTRVQATLGELNDLYVAERHYRKLAKARPQAWFAVGWLRAMQHQQKDAAQEAFAALAAAGRLKDS